MTDTSTKIKDTFSSAKDAISDATLTARVKAKLYASSEIPLGRISVETNDAKVTLSGSVYDYNTVEIALQIASETEGVQEVQNKLDIV